MSMAQSTAQSPTRRTSLQVAIGAVRVGGNAPIVVQSMTNTDTADVEGTVQQVLEDPSPRRLRARARDGQLE